MSSQIHRVEVEFGGRTLALETGKLAGQANGALTVQYGDTVVLATAVADKPRAGLDFFPLLVDLEERMYAAGKMPGSRFVRREGRPAELATLTARLIDHAIRPLFPKGALDDVQVVITTLAADPDFYPDFLGIIGASAALHLSDLPFAGPISATKVAWLEGDLIVNPTYEQAEESELELVVAGVGDRVLMIECEGREVPEDILVEAMELGLKAGEVVCEAQEELRKKAGKPKFQMTVKEVPEDVTAAVARAASTKMKKALIAKDKDERDEALNTLRGSVEESLAAEPDAADQQWAIRQAFDKLSAKVTRELILEKGQRPDGRKVTEVRPLSSEVGVLPRVHGSALFQRGETQALCVATLATLGESKILNGLHPQESKRYLHHYNFPPYSTGETKPMRTPGRREIGHGALAEKALRPVLPSEEDFPYCIRVVSEIMSSNGSTSMASCCGSTLALMDAGVPIEAPVAGISVGLVTSDKDPEKHVLLTDIQGIEDFCGDMDFKVAGTRQGVTAIQLDQKLHGVPVKVLAEALEQAREARFQILDVMEETLEEPRGKLSPHAPKIFSVQIPVDKIGALIGPGGKVIRGLQQDTGTKIDVEEDGTVYIATPDEERGNIALNIIRNMTREPIVGEEYQGKVVRILGIGAFCEIIPGKDGLVHISELDWTHVDRVEDVVNVGDEIKVKVIEVDSQGRINLSRKQCLPRPEGGEGGPGDGGDEGPRSGGGGGRDRDRGRGGDRDRSRRPEGRSYGRDRERGPARDSNRDSRPRERAESRGGDRGNNRPERDRGGDRASEANSRSERPHRERGPRPDRPQSPRSAIARKATSRGGGQKLPPKQSSQPQQSKQQKLVIDHTKQAVRPGDHLVSREPAIRPWSGSGARTPHLRSRNTRNG